MAFTGSDICKVSFPLKDHYFSHNPLTSTLTDLVRPVSSQVMIVNWSHSFASFAILLPPVGVALEKGCGTDVCINIILVSCPYHSFLPNSANIVFADPYGLPVRLYSRLVFIPNSLQPPRSALESFTVRESYPVVRLLPTLTASLLYTALYIILKY